MIPFTSHLELETITCSVNHLNDNVNKVWDKKASPCNKLEIIQMAFKDPSRIAFFLISNFLAQFSYDDVKVRHFEKLRMLLALIPTFKHTTVTGFIMLCNFFWWCLFNQIMLDDSFIKRELMLSHLQVVQIIILLLFAIFVHRWFHVGNAHMIVSSYDFSLF